MDHRAGMRVCVRLEGEQNPNHNGIHQGTIVRIHHDVHTMYVVNVDNIGQRRISFRNVGFPPADDDGDIIMSAGRRKTRKTKRKVTRKASKKSRRR